MFNRDIDIGLKCLILKKSKNFQTDFKLLLPPFFVLDVLRNPPVSGYEKCLLMVEKRPPGRSHLPCIHDFVYLYLCICVFVFVAAWPFPSPLHP